MLVILYLIHLSYDPKLSSYLSFVQMSRFALHKLFQVSSRSPLAHVPIERLKLRLMGKIAQGKGGWAIQKDREKIMFPFLQFPFGLERCVMFP